MDIISILFKALWCIIKYVFGGVFYLIWWIVSSISDKKRDRKEFIENYLDTFSSISSNLVDSYTPLKIDKDSIKEIRIDGLGKVDIEKAKINKGVFTIHCKKAGWYDAKYDILLYQEGVVVKFNSQYYLRAFNNNDVCHIDKVYKEVDLSFIDPIKRLKQILEKDYRYKAGHYYTKNGNIDRRYMNKYKDEFYVFNGEYKAYIAGGGIEISLLPNLKSVYKVFKDNFYQLNKEIPSLEDMISEPSGSVALLT